MPFEPGKSGNPKGTAPGKIWIAALNRAVAQDDGKRLREAAEKLLDLAAGGDVAALKELGDRLDGKPHQSTTISNEDGTALFSGIAVTFVRPDSKLPGQT